jgi:hypothetical protein
MAEINLLKDLELLINTDLRNKFLYDETYHIEIKVNDKKKRLIVTLSSEIENYSNLVSLYISSESHEELKAKQEARAELESQIINTVRRTFNVKDEIQVDYDAGMLKFTFDL